MIFLAFRARTTYLIEIRRQQKLKTFAVKTFAVVKLLPQPAYLNDQLKQTKQSLKAARDFWH